MKSAVGPFCVALAVWCASGLVTVVSADAATTRVIAPAPWWVFLLAFAIAFVIPGWRRSPLSALPALASTIPWWPVPFPSVALVWTGPLAWLPIFASLAAAHGPDLSVLLRRVPVAQDPSRATWLAGLLALVLGSATLWSLHERLPGGDEPHYLVITQSLLRDGDLRIENNHTQGDYREYFGGTLRPDYLNRGKDQAIYSIHAPGVSVLVLPGFAAFGLRGAQLTILACFVAMAMVVWRLGWHATGSAHAAWFATVAVLSAPTALLLGVMIFPDAPAALGTAIGAWLVVRLASHPEDVSARTLVLVGAALAVLPWLHTRFAVLAAGLGIVIFGFLGARSSDTRGRLRDAWSFLAVPALSAALWLWHFKAIYGVWDPRAPYRGGETIRDWIWGAVVGLFADQQFGLLVFAPVLVAAIAGWRAESRRLQWALVGLVGVVAVYVAAVASYHMWWAGLPGLPARFLTAAIPLLALPLALVWHRSGGSGRAILLAILAVSSLLAAVVVFHDRGALAFNFRDGQAAWLEWLSPVVNLPRAWPSFFWRSQGEFLFHVGAVAIVWAGVYFVVRLAVADVAGQQSRSTVIALGVILGLMISVQIGWRLNADSGLDPARSQLAAHGAGGLWTVGAFRVARTSNPGLLISPDEAPLSDRPSPIVMEVGPVPAGEYTVTTRGFVIDAAPNTITARIGRRGAALATWRPTGAPKGESFPLSLPAGAAALVIDADPVALAQALQVGLEPVGPALPGRAHARAFMGGTDSRTFFLDDHVFVEADGFWIRGGREASVVIAAGVSAAGKTRTLAVRNGGAANQLTVGVGGWSQTVPLAEWQETTLTLPVADATGSWNVTLRSESGFRPSDTGGSDQRYLGVWIAK